MKKFFGINSLVKKICKCSLSILLTFTLFSFSFGDYNSFLSNLRQLGIDVDSILQSKSVDRYELARLLNGVNCKDCIHPENDIQSLYTYQWWNDFSNRDGNEFDDISYLGGSYKGQSYYYCLAYVGDNSWMRGYPSGVSPICDGKFCGTRTTTIGEFLQVVLNIADQYVYEKYLVDWTKVKAWMDGLTPGSYADTYLTTNEKSMITEYANKKLSGVLPNEESLQAYIKYCMFNLDNCGMQKFGAVGQGYWPVAELNILYDNNIVEYEKFEDGQTSQLVDGKYVLETLYNLFEIIDCNFDYDYDCDGLINKDDNCPNTYNLNQTDTDGDSVGDVCDDDIDGDGIKNPIGIVDDLGSVVISKYEKNMDNCLFMPNWNQSDSDKNGFGDVCDQNNLGLGMYIHVSPIKTTAPATVAFQAVTEGNVKGDFRRSFGDGTTGTGRTIAHNFDKFGLYTVQVTAEGYGNNAKASTTVFIGKDIQSDFALQIRANKSHINAGEDITFTIDKKGSFDYFQISFGNGNVVQQNNANPITKRFSDEGTYMVTIKGFKDGKIVAVADTVVGIGENTYSSNMIISNVSPKKGDSISANTTISGFSKNDISSISRDFGGEKVMNKNLTQGHIFQTEGIYVIMQTITLNNGISLNNFATVYVGNLNMNSSYSIESIPNHLLGIPTDTFNFSTQQVGTVPSVSLSVFNYGDGQSNRTYDNPNLWPKSSSHQYINGIYMPQSTVYVDDCIALNSESTIVVDAGDICLKALLDGTLSSFQGDLDGDQTPDVCDDDIDGDGMPNLIGVFYNNTDNTNNNGSSNSNGANINLAILALHKNTCQLDNCPTISNQNQLDLNNNGRGDSCDDIPAYKNASSYASNILSSNFATIFNNNHTQNNGVDSDGDGIADSLDACPTLPENYNGVQDFDGCPEIGATNNCSLTNYDYVNKDFSVYPTINTTSDRLILFNPPTPVPACKGDDCKNLCLGNVKNCSSCNGDPNCELCQQNPGFCGSRTGGTGPYTLTVWCQPENIFHTWNNITSYTFSFADTFAGTCPCKQCNRFVRDVNGLISNLGKFSVCGEKCSDDINPDPNIEDGDRIIIDDPDDIIPPCKGDGCDICEGTNCDAACVGNTSDCPSCNGDKNCELCRKNPELCGTWTGGTGPYELSAWCEDDVSNIYTRYDITSRIFSFSDYFEYKNECRDCHRLVKDSKGLISDIGNFQVCPNIGAVSGPTGPVAPVCVGPNCTSQCTGANCNNCTGSNCVCVGDISSCPLCPDPRNPACDDCIAHPENCGCRDNREKPVSITARCDDNPDYKYNWSNLTGQCLSFDQTFLTKDSNSCNTCHRYLTDISGTDSNTRDFDVCPDTGSVYGPTGPVAPICVGPNCTSQCTGANCNNCTGSNCVCVGDISSCPLCPDPRNPACDDCIANPENCGCRDNREDPASITARCDDNPDYKYNWSNLTGQCLSFDQTFLTKDSNSCNTCHRYLTDISGTDSNTRDFDVCPDTGSVSGPTGPVAPVCVGPNCTSQCTGANCNNCTGSNCVCVGDISSCPLCPDPRNPACDDCIAHPENCGCRDNRDDPVSITARCDSEPDYKYNWSNLTGQCLSFDKIFLNRDSNSCDTCHRYLTDISGTNSDTKDFDVCNSGITIIDPIIPDPTCKGDNCNVCEGTNCHEVCIGDINTCNSCNGDTTCNLCKQNPDLCGSWTGGTGPYELQARCEDDLGEIYAWYNITDMQFSFANIWTGECPCKQCNRKIRDVNGLTSITGNFQVCAETCPWIAPIPIPEPVPSCEGGSCNTCTGDVNNCTCKDNPNCPDSECKNDPNCVPYTDDTGHSAIWTGNATGPFSLHAWCDDGQELSWTNITRWGFNLSNKFQGSCEPISCHRYVESSEGLRTNTTDFVLDVISSNECLVPSGPDPLPGCTGNCNNICVGDISKCPCKNNPACSANECSTGGGTCVPCTESIETSATRDTELDGPFNVVARCPTIVGNVPHKRTNIQDSCLNFNGIFKGNCPCNTCFRYVETANGNIKSETVPFQVCGNTCQPNPRIEPEPTPNPVPSCDGDSCNTCTGNVNNCPCKDNPNCTESECKNDPNCVPYTDDTGHSAIWTGNATGPFSLHARCDDGQELSWTNITRWGFNLSNKFQGSCEPVSCHRYVQSSEGLKTRTIDFTLETLDPGQCITPEGPDPIIGCEGTDCDNVCMGDITKCPCDNNPSCEAKACGKGLPCEDCENSEFAARWKTNFVGPFTVTVSCLQNPKLYIWSQINKHCIGFENVLEGSCPCNICQWSVSVKVKDRTISSKRTPFKVCGESCQPEPGSGDTIIPDIPGSIIPDGPIGPVIGCTNSENCNNCVGDIQLCITGNNTTGGNISGDIDQCLGSPIENHGTWSGGVGPYRVTARCEGEEVKQWFNIPLQCLSFENFFEGDCPCKQCHRLVQDINGLTSEILDFPVCKDECTPGDDTTLSPTPTPIGSITTPECLSCPCIYTDYGNLLSLNDDVKAILLDLGMTTLYSETIPVGIMQYLNQ